MFADKTRRPLEFARRFLVPNRRAVVVALCWVTWFAYHVATIRVGNGGDDNGLLHLLDVVEIGDNGHPERPGGGRSKEGALRLARSHLFFRAKIVRNLPTRGLHADGSDVEYRCRAGEIVHHPKAYRLWGGLNGTRAVPQPPLDRPGVFDFAASVSEMKLRVLIVGNSLGEQLHAGVEEAACFPPANVATEEEEEEEENATIAAAAPEDDRERWRERSSCETRFAENSDGQWIKEPRVVFTSSGGAIGVVKDNTNMMDTRAKWKKNNTAISSLVKVLDDREESRAENRGRKNRLLDVLIYQFQSGHVDLNDFDEYYLVQAIAAASDIFGATSVIFPTIAWMNNVDVGRVDSWREVNDRIRDFARRYVPDEGSTVESVQVLDIAALSNFYIEANARILNIPPNETYTLRLDSLFNSLVAQMCASLPFPEDPRGCSPGMVSHDGMHLCPETLHGRINAALLCLLDCKFHRRPGSLATCSDGCNSKYMNLDPVRFALDVHLKEEINLTP